MTSCRAVQYGGDVITYNIMTYDDMTRLHILKTFDGAMFSLLKDEDDLKNEDNLKNKYDLKITEISF